MKSVEKDLHCAKCNDRLNTVEERVGQDSFEIADFFMWILVIGVAIFFLLFGLLFILSIILAPLSWGILKGH